MDLSIAIGVDQEFCQAIMGKEEREFYYVYKCLQVSRTTPTHSFGCTFGSQW